MFLFFNISSISSWSFSKESIPSTPYIFDFFFSWTLGLSALRKSFMFLSADMPYVLCLLIGVEYIKGCCWLMTLSSFAFSAIFLVIDLCNTIYIFLGYFSGELALDTLWFFLVDTIDLKFYVGSLEMKLWFGDSCRDLCLLWLAISSTN